VADFPLGWVGPLQGTFRQIRWLQITTDPAERRRVPSSVVLEAHVGVDLDNEHSGSVGV
jgi:hypothetical protein